MLRFDINFLFTIINVLLMFIVVKLFLIRPVHKILDKRREEVESKYAEADRITEEALSSKKEYEDSIKNIEEEKERRFAEARNQANGEYDRMLEQARKESDRIIATAKKEAEEERQIRLRKANQEITDIVARATERIVTADQSDDMNKELYDRFLEQAK
ncbi:MAG: ATP synthase F0 subunit B [Lachnospiraceae bacterium]|nr:ATP synthase F0 subunit B [Lachnospiraceae bacterium]MBP1586728.1 ATP synthase F0 subunit B [Lachnospiraceae bacterium]